MYFNENHGCLSVIEFIPAVGEGEARPCWSDVAAVAGDVLPLPVVASCFAEAAADFEPPVDDNKSISNKFRLHAFF